MSKTVIALLLVISAFTGLNLALLFPEEFLTLGAKPDATSSETASSSATYFRGNNNDPTSTTTLLTVNNVERSETWEIAVTATATTSPAGRQHFIVEVSQDAITWRPLVLETVETLGAQATQINLLATSTVFTLATPANGALEANIVKVRNVAAKYMRVRAWASASSTLLVRVNRLSQ